MNKIFLYYVLVECWKYSVEICVAYVVLRRLIQHKFTSVRLADFSCEAGSLLVTVLNVELNRD